MEHVWLVEDLSVPWRCYKSSDNVRKVLGFVTTLALLARRCELAKDADLWGARRVAYFSHSARTRGLEVIDYGYTCPQSIVFVEASEEQ